MLYEGNVLACIQIVDEVSISTSVNFTIHVLIDPNDGSNFEETDDFTEFQKGILEEPNNEDMLSLLPNFDFNQRRTKNNGKEDHG